MSSNFAVFILSNGRPDNVITYKTIRNHGYTGPIYIIVDNLDKTKNEYYKKYGDKVIEFNKTEISKETDQGDNFNDLRTTTHVRNAMFKISKDLEIKYFIQLDDDYTSFSYTENRKGEYITKNKKIKSLDKIFEYMVDFYRETGVCSIAMSQGGDYLGGDSSSVFKKKLSRKCMNSFLCSSDRSFKFIGRLNEDVNTYVVHGLIGKLFFTISLIRLEQKATQSNEGGMTSTYSENGTYIKSFFTVMYKPSSVKISVMGNKEKRLHHLINWKTTVPYILREEIKK